MKQVRYVLLTEVDWLAIAQMLREYGFPYEEWKVKDDYRVVKICETCGQMTPVGPDTKPPPQPTDRCAFPGCNRERRSHKQWEAVLSKSAVQVHAFKEKGDG